MSFSIKPAITATEERFKFYSKILTEINLSLRPCLLLLIILDELFDFILTRKAIIEDVISLSITRISLKFVHLQVISSFLSRSVRRDEQTQDLYLISPR